MNVSLVIPGLSIKHDAVNYSKPAVPVLGLAAKNGSLPFPDAVGRVVNVTLSFALPASTNKTAFVSAFRNSINARSFAAKRAGKTGAPEVIAAEAASSGRKLAASAAAKKADAEKKAPAAPAPAAAAAAASKPAASNPKPAAAAASKPKTTTTKTAAAAPAQATSSAAKPKHASSAPSTSSAAQESVVSLPPDAFAWLPLNQTHVMLNATIAKLQQLG